MTHRRVYFLRKWRKETLSPRVYTAYNEQKWKELQQSSQAATEADDEQHASQNDEHHRGAGED